MGRDPGTSLWRFADLASGTAPGTEAAPGEESTKALEFVLVPGLELEGSVLPAFLIASGPVQVAHLAGSGLDLGEEAAQERVSLAWTRLGYTRANAIQEQLARKAGLRVDRDRHPVRPLRLSPEKSADQASLGE